MTQIIAELQSKAEIVILDSPPLLNVADTLLLAQLVDGVLFVVDAHSTGRATVLRAAEALQQAQITALGAVFNKVTAKDMSYYRYYYEGYGYSSHSPQNGNGRKFRLFGTGKNGEDKQRSPVEKK
jgi:non-specific protein-tyrosine kinase